MGANILPGIPVGSIVAFAGKRDPRWLKLQGWLDCDGSPLDINEYQELFGRIKNNYGGGNGYFNLPDLRGRFLRGVTGTSPNDPDAENRVASMSGGNDKNKVGSFQPFATGHPRVPFVTDMNPGHTHDVKHVPVKGNETHNYVGGFYAEFNNELTSTEKEGAHSHEITGGGDKETRPANGSLYFIIKYRGNAER